MDETPKVFESEYKFCLILWENEPIKSTQLVKICEEKLNWSKTTTYTVIKRLSERGVIKNENTIVSSLYSKEQIQSAEIDELIEKKFNDSLPEFEARLIKHRRITAKHIDSLREKYFGKPDVETPEPVVVYKDREVVKTVEVPKETVKEVEKIVYKDSVPWYRDLKMWGALVIGLVTAALLTMFLMPKSTNIISENLQYIIERKYYSEQMLYGTADSNSMFLLNDDTVSVIKNDSANTYPIRYINKGYDKAQFESLLGANNLDFIQNDSDIRLLTEKENTSRFVLAQIDTRLTAIEFDESGALNKIYELKPYYQNQKSTISLVPNEIEEVSDLEFSQQLNINDIDAKYCVAKIKQFDGLEWIDLTYNIANIEDSSAALTLEHTDEVQRISLNDTDITKTHLNTYSNHVNFNVIPFHPDLKESDIPLNQEVVLYREEYTDSDSEEYGVYGGIEYTVMFTNTSMVEDVSGELLQAYGYNSNNQYVCNGETYSNCLKFTNVSEDDPSQVVVYSVLTNDNQVTLEEVEEAYNNGVSPENFEIIALHEKNYVVF